MTANQIHAIEAVASMVTTPSHANAMMVTPATYAKHKLMSVTRIHASSVDIAKT